MLQCYDLMDMRNTMVLFLLFTAFFSCKEDSKSESDKDASKEASALKDNRSAKQNDGLIAVQGEFIYYADAAVLQTPSRIYGVVINDKMHELDKQAKPFKKEPIDMVRVTVRGRMFKKEENEEGWEDRFEIVEILKVSPPKPGDNNTIKLSDPI